MALASSRSVYEHLKPQTLHANSLDTSPVPDGFAAQPPKIAVLLPGPVYAQMMAESSSLCFEYHLLRNTEYNMFDPINFDADSYVEEAIAYCRSKRVDAVTAFDCFATFLASVVREELRLPGPSFASTLLCNNKYYMRKALTPDCQPYAAGEPPAEYPAVVKVSDTQFYTAVRIVQNEEEWRAAWAALTAFLGAGADARKRFYSKWATRFGLKGLERWEEVVLMHTEPYLESAFEAQVEIVVTEGGEALVADTGNVEHMAGGDNITMFKTPANLPMTPRFVRWLGALVDGMVARGFRGIAMDVEFMRLASDEEAYELNEINSRYSYMGDFRQFVEQDGDRAFCRAFLTNALKSLAGGQGSDGAKAGEALFAALDEDGDRSMTRGELKAALQRVGLYRDDASLDQVFGVLDANGDGAVSAAELSASLLEAMEALQKEPKEVRNLLNRTRLALGAAPASLPCRDEAGVSKLAVAVFTERLGPIGSILDQAAVDSFLADRTFDTWCPEPPVTRGEVVAADQVYGGWARLGYILMTWEDNLPEINERLRVCVEALHLQKDGGWLPVQLRTTEPVPKELRPRYDLLLGDQPKLAPAADNGEVIGQADRGRCAGCQIA